MNQLREVLEVHAAMLKREMEKIAKKNVKLALSSAMSRVPIMHLKRSVVETLKIANACVSD